MMRRCAWCGLDQGEKCSKCGEPGHAMNPGDSYTMHCENFHIWTRGEGGITDGLCPDCKDEHFPPERAAVTSSGAVV